MRILEVLDCYYPKFDGPTQVVTYYCKSLQKIDGTEVETLVPYYPKYKDNQPFNVIRCRSMFGTEGYRTGIPMFDFKLKKMLDEKKYDIIHFHSPFTMGRYVAKFGKKYNIPTVFTFHTKYKDDIYRDTKIPLFRKIAMNFMMKTIGMADRVIAVSDGAKECLKSYGYNGNIDVIRNGTDLVYPTNKDELVARVNTQFGLKESDNILLSVGRIVKNKKLELAIEALKIVKEKGYQFKFLIVGKGNYEHTLKKLVVENGLSENVIFAGKIMDRELLSGVYLRSDLFIFPSTFDTASLAPIEAAAMGIPTLMTKGCCTAEIITDERNGLLADQNPSEWAEKIISILTDKEKLEMLKTNARLEVYRSWDSVVEEVYAYYQDLIKEKNK